MRRGGEAGRRRRWPWLTSLSGRPRGLGPWVLTTPLGFSQVLSPRCRPRNSTWSRRCPAPRGPWRAAPPRQPRASGGRRSSGPGRSGPSCGEWRTTSTHCTSGGDKRRSSGTAPRLGGSCTISSWDCSPYPGAVGPPRWSPTRCLHPPGGRPGLGGQAPPTSWRPGQCGGRFLHHVAYWTTSPACPGAGGADTPAPA